MKPRANKQKELRHASEKATEKDPGRAGPKFKQQIIKDRAAFQDTGEHPGWFEEYETLVEAGWEWRIAAFIAWSSTPRALRWPKTQKELAIKVLGLQSGRQIAAWKRKDPGIQNTIASLLVSPMLDYRADVIQALIESAIVPDPRHAKDRRLFLEIAGIYVPAAKAVREPKRRAGRGVREMSDAELERYLPRREADEGEDV